MSYTCPPLIENNRRGDAAITSQQDLIVATVAAMRNKSKLLGETGEILPSRGRKNPKTKEVTGLSDSGWGVSMTCAAAKTTTRTFVTSFLFVGAKGKGTTYKEKATRGATNE